MISDLARKVLAELIGTGVLVAAIVGSGIAAQRLSSDVGLQLLENAAATAGVLVAIILALGPVSGAHFNPVVTLAGRYFGGVTNREAIAYISAQIAGGCLGAVTANVMFAEPLVELSDTHRASGAHVFAEVVATFGLVLVIFGVVRSGRAAAAPFAVGAYIGSGYFFTSSTSVANPAVAIGRTLSGHLRRHRAELGPSVHRRPVHRGRAGGGVRRRPLPGPARRRRRCRRPSRPAAASMTGTTLEPPTRSHVSSLRSGLGARVRWRVRPSDHRALPGRQPPPAARATTGSFVPALFRHFNYEGLPALAHRQEPS